MSILSNKNKSYLLNRQKKQHNRKQKALKLTLNDSWTELRYLKNQIKNKTHTHTKRQRGRETQFLQQKKERGM